MRGNSRTVAADGPLGGVRVIDLTNVIMGPFATHILADMGADVIKIESPEGDLFRNYKPVRNEGMSGNFLHLNRNKRSVVLDLKAPADCTTLDALIATADVFVHALRPRAIAKLGYGYDHVRSLKSDIIYCGAYGFGANGPYGDKAAYDDLSKPAPESSLVARMEGEPGYLPTVICDKLAVRPSPTRFSRHSFSTVAPARAKRSRCRCSKRRSSSSRSSTCWASPSSRRARADRLYARLLSPRAQTLSHGRRLRVHLAVLRPQLAGFYRFTGRSEYADDPRYNLLADACSTSTLYALLEEEGQAHHRRVDCVLDDVSIPCMPVLSLEELIDDEHVRAVGLFSDAEHPTEGRYRSIRSPLAFSSRPFAIRRHAPRLGEHTNEILEELDQARDATAP